MSDLARNFGVTEETIRRDLKKLSAQGRLVRTHGGAVAAGRSQDLVDLPFKTRSAEQAAQKRAIAQRAVASIQPGETIALDASSTATELARLLPDQPLTVVTNSLAICTILARHQEVQTVCTGGILDSDAMAFVGLSAERSVELFNLSAFYFSCRGIDLDRGVSESNDREAALKLRLIRLARRRVLMADTSKFGLASAVFYAPVDVVDQLITDNTGGVEADQAIQTVRSRGVAVDIVEVDP